MPWQLRFHSNEVWGWCLLSQRTFMPNVDSIQLRTKELLTYHCGCHGNEVWDWCLSSQRTSIPNLDSMRLKTKELQSKMYLTQTHRLRLVKVCADVCKHCFIVNWYMKVPNFFFNQYLHVLIFFLWTAEGDTAEDVNVPEYQGKCYNVFKNIFHHGECERLTVFLLISSLYYAYINQKPIKFVTPSQLTCKYTHLTRQPGAVRNEVKGA